MTSWQKAIKYAAMAFAIFLAVSIIAGIVGALAGLDLIFGREKESTAGEMKTYEISGEIDQLDIEIGAADFRIKYGDEFRVESNLNGLNVQEKNGRLTITEKDHFGLTYNSEVKLDLYIPEGTVFDKADITTGAGLVTIGELTADTLKLELGAGKVEIDSLTALRNSEIHGGAGEITIRGGALSDLDLDMGVGELNLTSELTGECDLDCGVGASYIVLLGSEEDYRIEIDKGLGEAVINGHQAVNSQTYGSGRTEIDVDGGVGKIEISFHPQ